jgi:hypothetical protein
VAALHSFWYAVALDEFRESTRIEPDFMVGYWGEKLLVFFVREEGKTHTVPLR